MIATKFEHLQRKFHKHVICTRRPHTYYYSTITVISINRIHFATVDSIYGAKIHFKHGTSF